MLQHHLQRCTNWYFHDNWYQWYSLFETFSLLIRKNFAKLNGTLISKRHQDIHDSLNCYKYPWYCLCQMQTELELLNCKFSEHSQNRLVNNVYLCCFNSLLITDVYKICYILLYVSNIHLYLRDRTYPWYKIADMDDFLWKKNSY